MKRVLMLALVLASFVSTSVFARPFTTAEKLTDFRGLVAQIKSGYGPLLYKKEKLGIDIDQLALEYEAKLAATTTNRDFYYTVAKFISEFKDGHFNPTIPTTHQKDLPLGFDLVGDKVRIDWIDRTKLSEADFPFQRGDELQMFDGQAVEDLVTELMTLMQSGTERSIRRKAVWTIALRRGSRVPVPTGTDVGETKIVHAQTGRVETVTPGLLKWKEAGEALDEFEPAKERPLAQKRNGVNYGMLSIRDEYMDLLGKARLERSYACNPGTRIKIPEGATIIMNPPDKGPFTAYYHYDARFGGNVGYLRIPDYFPMDAQGQEAYDERFRQYEYAIDVLERNTVGLIIDQDHNCGGSVDYLERLLGLFYSAPYQGMMFELLATKESYFDFKKWLDEEVYPFSIEADRFQNVLNLIKTSADVGTSWLTAKTHIGGRESFPANPVHYTKPIVVLVDEMAGSGGDAFPSILGFQRATLVGTRTGGLGGHVQDLNPLYYSRMGGRLTKSLFYRADGVAVENNGAEPAAENQYTPTYNDFIDGYREYQEFYLNKLLQLVRP